MKYLILAGAGVVALVAIYILRNLMLSFLDKKNTEKKD